MSASHSPSANSIVQETDAEGGDTARVRKRARRCGNACNRCKSRKQRCDGEIPCSNCVHSKQECVYEILPTRRADSVSLNYIAALEERCAHLESALRRADPRSEDVQDHLQPSRLPQALAAGVEGGIGDEAGDFAAIVGDVPQSSTATPSHTPHPSQSSDKGTRGMTKSQGTWDDRPDSLGAGGPSGYPAFRAGTPAANTDTQQQQSAETAIRQHVDRLSMKAFAETPYIDGLSGMSFAKIAKASMRKGKTLSPTPFQNLASSRWRAQRAPGEVPLQAGSGDMPNVPSDALAEALYRAAYLHVQARYPFMQWPLLLAWHKRRAELCVRDQDLADVDDRTGAFFLWLVYAVGAHLLTQGVGTDSTAEHYFAASRLYFDDVLARHDLLTVQALAMTAMYSFRADDGPSVWHLIGFAMRICIEYGLHRKLPPLVRKNDPLGSEVKCRVFWAIYTLDRLVSLSLGRPPSINDIDVDAEQPLDIDCYETDPSIIQAAYDRYTSGTGPLAPTITSMSSARHWIKMYQIRSKIVSRMKVVTPLPDDAIRSFLDELEVWKVHMPREDDHWDPADPLPLLTIQRLLKGYYLTVTMLLRPNLSAYNGRNDPFLLQLAEAAAQCCELENQIIASPNPGHSMAALYSTFISGLTLLHALANQRDVFPARRSARAIRACSSVLVAYATLFPEAQSFRAMFESLVDGMEEEAEVASLAVHHQKHNMVGKANGHQAGEGGVVITAGTTVTNTNTDSGIGYTAPYAPPAVPIWQKKVQDLGSMLQGNFQQDFVNLVNTFGFTPNMSTDEMVNSRTNGLAIENRDPTTLDPTLTLSGGFDFPSVIDFAALFEST